MIGKVETIYDGTKHIRTADIKVGDSEITLANGEAAVISHASVMQVGYMPREESKKTIGIIVVDTSGDENLGLGFLMSPVEARSAAQSLMQLADEQEARDGQS